MLEIRIHGQEHELEDGITVIGRGKDADIQLSEDKLSRLHSRFSLTGTELKLEDLGSKNGTFVNGQRLESSRTLVKGDKVRLADVAVEIAWPGTPAAADSAPAAEEKTAAAATDVRPRKLSGSQAAMIKKIVALIVVVIAAALAYNYIAGYETEGLIAARELVDETETWLEGIEPSEDPLANRDALDELNRRGTALKEIPGEYSDLYARAGEMIRKIHRKRETLAGINLGLETQAKARGAYDAVIKDHTGKALDSEAAIVQLNNLMRLYPDTKAAEEAGAKVRDLENVLAAAERDLIARTRIEAEGLLRNKAYRRAVDAADICLAAAFKRIEASELDSLKEIRARAVKAAGREFESLCSKAISQAATQDCEALAKELKIAFKTLDFPDLDPVLHKALTRINAIRQERIARARVLLARELAAVEALEKKRMYVEAADQYKRLLPSIAEKELFREVARKSRHSSLLAAAKHSIITYVNKQGGVSLEKVGNIKSMNSMAVTLQMEDVSMELPWDKIRDSEFLMLLNMSLQQGTADAELYVAHAVLLLNKGNTLEGDKWLARARKASAGIVQTYPDIFAAAAERLAAVPVVRPGPPSIGKGKSMWQVHGMGGGGSIFYPAVSPYDPKLMFVSCDMSGFYRSEDGGATWRMIPFTQMIGFLQCSAAFAPDDRTVYAWTGKEYHHAPMISRDRGVNWVKLENGPDEDGRSICISSKNKGLVVIGTTDSIWTAQDGERFTKVQPDTGMVGGIFIHPETEHIAVGAQKGIYLSEDRGRSFERVTTSGLTGQIRSFSGGVRGKRAAYSVVMWSNYDGGGGMRGSNYRKFQGLFRSADLKTWEKCGTDIPGTAKFVFTGMAIANPDIMYAAGCEKGWPAVYRSSDSGKTWKQNFQGMNNANIESGWSGHRNDTGWGFGEHIYGFTVSRGNPEIAMFTDMGYTHVTFNGGKLWRQAYAKPKYSIPAGQSAKGKFFQTAGLEVTSCWDIDWFGKKDVVISFTDIKGIRSEDGGRTWTRDIPGFKTNTTYQVVPDPDAPQTTGYAVLGTTHDIYQSTYIANIGGTGYIMKTTDRGHSWTELKAFGKPVVRLAIDPNDHNLMYTSVVQDGLYRSNDRGKTWNKTAPPSPQNSHVYDIKILSTGRVICTVSADKRSGSFAATSGVFISDDKGASWTDISHPDMKWWTMNVTVDPRDEKTLYVGVYSGWGNASSTAGGLFRTRDSGKTWKRIDGLPEPAAIWRVYEAFVHPDDPNIVFFTTEVSGLWKTTNGTADMPVFKLVEDFPFGHPTAMVLDPHDRNKLWVMTFGGGAWSGPAR